MSSPSRASMSRILFDHNVPIGLRALLPDHEVTLAREIAWAQLANGALLLAAEQASTEAVLRDVRQSADAILWDFSSKIRRGLFENHRLRAAVERQPQFFIRFRSAAAARASKRLTWHLSTAICNAALASMV